MTPTDTTLGPYVLERELGRGAFGVVYQAHPEGRPDTRVAIKTIEARGDLDRMLVEPALLARLKHPCIVGLEEYFVHQGKLVLALEFVPGEDLKAYLDRGETFGPDQVRDLLAQIGSALAEAHSQQIVHRDLKPSNILVDTSGGRTRYVLTDFGVGRTADGVQSEKHVGGTYLYMAPEQLRGRPAPQSDLWALGVVAYQLLTGRLPFPGPTLGELAKQIHYTDPLPPGEVRGEPLPADLEAAVLGLLNKSLSERTGSAAELLRAVGAGGDTRKVFESKAGSRGPAAKSALPLAAALDHRAVRAKWRIGAALLVYMLAVNVLSTAINLLALYTFYRAQVRVEGRRKRVLLTVGSFILMVLAPVVAQVAPALSPTTQLNPQTSPAARAFFDRLTVDYGPGVALSLLVGVMLLPSVVFIVSPMVGSAAYADLRRTARERTLLKAALAGRAGSDEFLTLMKDMLATRFEDVGFHLRYAEMLYARGDHRGAAVEARLICVQDPYHFNANLLLANAYYALRLYPDCERVCDEYLAVAGYCFEFQELRQQCEGRSARP